MKCYLALLVLPLIFVVACDRRPVQKDIQIDNTVSRSEHSNVESSPGAADAPFELQFIDTLIAHSLDTIDAAQLVATRAQHAELKQFAKTMISDRQQQISQLREWRTRWYGKWAPAINLDLPGMRESGGIDFEKLDSLKESAFDVEFLNEILPHERGSVSLAQDVLGRQTNEELKKVAEDMLKTRGSEIDQMQAWRSEW